MAMAKRARIHRPLKRDMELKVEELEQRVAPVTLTDGMTYQFMDGNGDAINVEFLGKGSATILAVGVDPDNADITHIDFFKTEGNSRLYIRDSNPGAGGDDLTCGAVASVQSAAMGVLELNSPRVYDTTITMNNLLTQLYVGGMMDNVTLDANSSVKAIVVEGVVDGSTINVSGDIRSFSSLGMVNSSTLNVMGRLAKADIKGDLDNSAILVASQAASVNVSGDAISSAIICFTGGGTIQVGGNVDDTFLESRFGNARQIYIGGSVDNGSFIRAMQGKVGMVYVGGDFIDSTLDCTSAIINKIQIDGSVLGVSVLQPVMSGKCTSLNIVGNVIGTDAANRVQINFESGIAASTLIGGYAQWMDINSSSVDHRILNVRGLMTESTVTAQFGTMGRLQIDGDVHTNVVIAGQQETIKDLSIGGDLYGNSVVAMLMGSIHRVSVEGDVYGASQPFNGLMGSCQSITVGGSMYGAASITGVNTTIRAVEVRGYLDEAASIQVTNGDIFNITIKSGMFDGANITADGGSLFNITVGMQMDQLAGASPFILVGNGGVLGNVVVNGLMSGAQIDATGGTADYRSQIRISGDILNSNINIGGGSSCFFQAQGNVNNSFITFTGGEVDSFRITGNVDDSDIFLGSSVQQISVSGHVDDVDWTILGNTQSVKIGGYVNLLNLWFLGYCDTIQITGYMADSTIELDPGLDFGFGRLRIGGYVDNVYIESGSPVDQLAIKGDVTDTVIVLFSSARDVRIGGSMTDSDLNVNGSLDSLFIMGDIVDTGPSIFVLGETGSCTVRGTVDTGLLTFNAQVDRLRLGGMWGASVNVIAGGVRSFMLQGDMDNGSVITVNGFSGRAQLLGDVANGSTLDFNNGLDALQIAGMLDSSVVTIRNGNYELNYSTATKLGVGDGMWGASVITIEGDCSMAKIRGGMNDTASLNITGYTRRIGVSGDITVGATVVVGSTFVSASGRTYYTGTLEGMRVNGLLYGQVQVIGDLDTVSTSGTTADPEIPYTGPAPFTGGFLTKDAFGNPTLVGRVDYVTLLPGGGVD